MIKVNKHGILLDKTEHVFEKEGVLNPAVIQVGHTIHMFYRAVTKGNYSTIGYCKLSGPTVVESRNTSPLLRPEWEYEYHGLEDPRIVYFDGLFYMTYTAYNGANALAALATSPDLVTWTKHGIIAPQITYAEFLRFAESTGGLPEKYDRFNAYHKDLELPNSAYFMWDKNLIFFPRKIDKKIWFIHRIRPDIQIVKGIDHIEDLTQAYWQNYFLQFDSHILLSPHYEHEVSYIGGGCPPIETKSGWLLIYHGVHDTVDGYVYSACAALLDIADPGKEIARLPFPLFVPDQPWELKGNVNNVCFPTGTVIDYDRLYIYYGAADERVAVASVSLTELLHELEQHKKPV